MNALRAFAGRLAVLAAVIGCVPAAHAQEPGLPRSGIVIDESGAAIAGARLVVRSAQGGALREAASAADGTFALGPLPPGSYWLDVTAPGFAIRRTRLEVNREDAAALRTVLALARFESEVTVTAGRGAIAEVDRTPSIVTVRDADEFRARPLATLGNALEAATGVMVQQSTSGQASPFLRGLTGHQVLNLIDGIRFNNTTFRSGPNQYIAFVDPSQGQRIEAMLGPAGAQFGSDAMGGAIQVLTPAADFKTVAGSARAAPSTCLPEAPTARSAAMPRSSSVAGAPPPWSARRAARWTICAPAAGATPTTPCAASSASMTNRSGISWAAGSRTRDSRSRACTPSWRPGSAAGTA